MKATFFDTNAGFFSKISALKRFRETQNALIAVAVFLAFSVSALAVTSLPEENPGNTKTNKSTTAELPVFEFRATKNSDELNAVPKELIEQHALGETIAAKLYLFESKYTYQTAIVPGNPQTRTIIRKPVVYEAVKKIERNLKKQVKKGEITAEIASSEFNKVLDVASNILTADTSEFEKAISATNDVNSLTTLFTMRVNLVFFN